MVVVSAEMTDNMGSNPIDKMMHDLGPVERGGGIGAVGGSEGRVGASKGDISRIGSVRGIDGAVSGVNNGGVGSI